MTDEWITVSEYAMRRKISERQARRQVAALPEDCRTSPEIRPAKVKWCPATSGTMSEETAVLGAIAGNTPPYGPDQGRPGADQWQECPADVRPNVQLVPDVPYVTSDAQYQALTKAFEVLQQQLAAKDRLIDEQAATIRELTSLVDQAQQLHRSDQQERAALKQIEPPRRTWFQMLLAGWKDTRIDQ